MSDTVDREDEVDGEVNSDDLRKMLADARSKVTSLERERDTERRHRTQIERERDDLAGTVVTESGKRYQSEVDAVTNAIQAGKADADRAEQALVMAHEAGDARAIATAQRELARAEAKLERYETRKVWLDDNKEILTKPAIQQTQRQEAPQGDEFDKVVKGGLMPNEKRWARERPEFLTDTRYRNRVFGASQMAVADGLERDTPEYFRRIEELIGESVRSRQADDDEPPARKERRASADLAPSRSQPGTREAGKRFTLSAQEREMADNLYGEPTSPNYVADQTERYQRYATNRDKMRAAGRLN